MVSPNALCNPFLASILASVAVTLAGQPLAGQEGEPADADAVAREMSNPVGSLASLNLQATYTRFGGSAPAAVPGSGSGDAGSGASLRGRTRSARRLS